MPKTPECWDTCGNCAQGEVFVLEIHVAAGDRVRHDDPLITLETGKVALDIPSPHAGRIVEVLVAEGDVLAEGRPICRIEAE
ncbi:MAG: dihydrolipoamide acyltransferase [Rhodocyclaceae bacterium]|nr:dihydrolipoamide acyltransferase [Rhodocyclaceae bacterium]